MTSDKRKCPVWGIAFTKQTPCPPPSFVSSVSGLCQRFRGMHGVGWRGEEEESSDRGKHTVTRNTKHCWKRENDDISLARAADRMTGRVHFPRDSCIAEAAASHISHFQTGHTGASSARENTLRRGKTCCRDRKPSASSFTRRRGDEETRQHDNWTLSLLIQVKETTLEKITR